MRRGAAALVCLLFVASCSGDKKPPATSTTTTVDRAAAFCATVEALPAVDPFMAVVNAANEIEAEKAFDEGLATIRPLAETAPAEIEPSAVAYVEGFEAYGELLAATGYNGSQVDRDALADITQKVGTARAEIEAYATRSC